jgi:hypothetical protein
LKTLTAGAFRKAYATVGQNHTNTEINKLLPHYMAHSEKTAAKHYNVDEDNRRSKMVVGEMYRLLTIEDDDPELFEITGKVISLEEKGEIQEEEKDNDDNEEDEEEEGATGQKGQKEKCIVETRVINAFISILGSATNKF